MLIMVSRRRALRRIILPTIFLEGAIGASIYIGNAFGPTGVMSAYEMIAVYGAFAALAIGTLGIAWRQTMKIIRSSEGTEFIFHEPW